MEGESNTTKPKEGVELKGGHEPAKMVGGRRIVTRERHSESEDKTTPKKPTEQAEEEEEEFGEDKPAKQASSVVISGAKSSEEAAFPKEAVKAYHDKPMPTHDKASSAHSKPKIIQQPKIETKYKKVASQHALLNDA
jgi:hypothetical protein